MAKNLIIEGESPLGCFASVPVFLFKGLGKQYAPLISRYRSRDCITTYRVDILTFIESQKALLLRLPFLAGILNARVISLQTLLQKKSQPKHYNKTII